MYSRPSFAGVAASGWQDYSADFPERVEEDKGQHSDIRRALTYLGMFGGALACCLSMLTPLVLVALWIYQCCFTQQLKELKTTTSAATFLLSVFLAIAWIPSANLIVYSTLKKAEMTLNTTNATSGSDLQLHGLMPLGSFVFFLIWALAVAFRHGSVTDSYEHDENRETLMRLGAYPLDPPIHVDTIMSLETIRQVRKRQAEMAPSAVATATLSGQLQADPYAYQYQGNDFSGPIQGSQVPSHRQTGSTNQHVDTSGAMAAAYAKLIHNARDYYIQLKRKQHTGGIVAICLSSFAVALVLVAIAVWVQLCPGFYTQDPPNSTYKLYCRDTIDRLSKSGLTQVLYIFAYTYYLGMFTLVATALLFVRKTYKAHVAVVESVTSLAVDAVDRIVDGTSEAVPAAVPQSTGSMAGGFRASRVQSVAEVDDKHDRLLNSRPQFHERAGSLGPARRDSLVAAFAPTAQSHPFDPLNMNHLNAWEAMRKVCVDEITEMHTVLNSVFDPTMLLTLLGFFGSLVYFLYQLYKSRSDLYCAVNPYLARDQVGFIFGPVGVTLASVLLICFVYDFTVVFMLARKCRHAFKRQLSAVTKLEFALTTLLYEMIWNRCQGYQRTATSGKVNEQDMYAIFSKVSNMQVDQSTFQPRPRILNIDSSRVKYFFLYFFLATALALSILIALPVNRNSNCQKNS